MPAKPKLALAFRQRVGPDGGENQNTKQVKFHEYPALCPNSRGVSSWYSSGLFWNVCTVLLAHQEQKFAITNDKCFNSPQKRWNCQKHAAFVPCKQELWYLI